MADCFARLCVDDLIRAVTNIKNLLNLLFTRAIEAGPELVKEL